MKINTIIDSSQFAKDIHDLVIEKSCEYFEAIMIYAERHGYELDTVAQLVRQNNVIKAKLAEECETLNLLQKTARLPI